MRNPTHFGINDLRRSELDVTLATDAYVPALARNYPGLIDIMLNLPYYWGGLDDPVTARGEFEFFASSHYLQAPYTAWSLFEDCRLGYYLEAAILLRSLVEVLVQLRYFHRHPDQLRGHFAAGRGVSFRTMFDEFAPGYYRGHYGNVFSAFAHGKAGQLFFRYDRSDPKNHRIRMGCEFDVDHMSFVVNNALAVIFGLLNLFPTFLPANTLASDAGMEADRLDALRWLEGAMDAHRTGFPQSKPWYALVDKIIRP